MHQTEGLREEVRGTGKRKHKKKKAASGGKRLFSEEESLDLIRLRIYRVEKQIQKLSMNIVKNEKLICSLCSVRSLLEARRYFLESSLQQQQ